MAMALKNRQEIVFFDVETTVPSRTRQKFTVLEFGAILVCPRKLVEIEHFCTLIRPADLSIISQTSARCNGITRDAVAAAPTFEEIADKIFDFLDELFQRNLKGTPQRLAFRTVGIADLDKLFVSGRSVDVDYSVDMYDYHQNAGIRLVARRLIVECE